MQSTVSGSGSSNASVTMLVRLAEQGHRMTGPRQTIVELVAPRLDTFSAQEVVDELEERRVPVGRATVFRTLDLLAELGILHRIHNDNGYHLYAVCGESRHHHHLRCISCGMIRVIQAPAVEAELERVGDRLDFEVLDHVIELVGLCSACKKAEDKR